MVTDESLVLTMSIMWSERKLKEVKGQPAMQYKLVNEQQYENQKGYDTMIFVIASWPLLLVVKEI